MVFKQEKKMRENEEKKMREKLGKNDGNWLFFFLLRKAIILLKCDQSQDRGKFSPFHEDDMTTSKKSLYVSTRLLWSVCMCIYCQSRKRVSQRIEITWCSFSDMEQEVAMTLSVCGAFFFNFFFFCYVMFISDLLVFSPPLCFQMSVCFNPKPLSVNSI